MDNFKSAVHHVQQRGGGAAAAVWETGISSEVTELPAGFEHRTMLVAGRGITATMDAWGTALRKAYGTNHSAVFDRNIEYLSYWTDNGAYYSGGAWMPPAGGAGGGGEVVNEEAFKAVARGLKAQVSINVYVFLRCRLYSKPNICQDRLGTSTLDPF